MSRIASPLPLSRCSIALAILLPALLARADEPAVHFVGIQRDCERDGQLDRAVERRLFQKGTTVGLVRQSTGAPLPPCFGDSCAQRFKESCPATRGRLLGGQVVQDKDVLKVRLWLHDLATGQTAFQDEYCQSCEVVGTLATQAARLIAAPRFGAAPSATPQYCGPQASVSAAPQLGPLFLTVYGDGKHKAPLLAALKQQLALIGRKVLPVPVESKTYTSDVLQRIVAGQKSAQVLGVEVQKEGKVQMFLYDQKTELSDGKLVECGDCEKDKEALISRVQPEVPTMLEHCFSEACGSSNPAAPPPPAACEPFPDPVCGGTTTAQSSLIAPSSRYMDPMTAKLVKGSIWGLFAASAATTAALFIANSTSAGTIAGDRGEATNGLIRPAWAMLGASAAIFGVAVPLTIAVNRTQRSTSNSSSNTVAPQATIQCPN